MAGIFIAAIALLLKRSGDLRTRFLLSQFLPIYGLFLFFSLNSAGKANWTVPALVTGIIFTVAFWRELAARQPAWRWVIGGAFAIAFVMTAFVHTAELFHVPQKFDPLHRAQGWPDFAAHIEKAREDNRADLLIGSHYSIASLMTFYLPSQPAKFQPGGACRDRWGRPRRQRRRRRRSAAGRRRIGSGVRSQRSDHAFRSDR
jgi:hypothetical protein